MVAHRDAWRDTSQRSIWRRACVPRPGGGLPATAPRSDWPRRAAMQAIAQKHARITSLIRHHHDAAISRTPRSKPRIPHGSQRGHLPTRPLTATYPHRATLYPRIAAKAPSQPEGLYGWPHPQAPLPARYHCGEIFYYLCTFGVFRASPAVCGDGRSELLKRRDDSLPESTPRPIRCHRLHRIW